ncbi:MULTISPECIES: AMP-binding protein [Amycolatopsis]|uniref:AMP-binding protein n=2 Tax=Pseudonocardiaceae TaxID=2070 RepID=UPI000B8A6E72|nr:AMP-dependent synthetase [Amycolatopsis sp. KNN50.9b]
MRVADKTVRGTDDRGPPGLASLVTQPCWDTSSWNRKTMYRHTEQFAPGPKTVPARLAARAADRPDEIALLVPGQGSLTFAEWDQRSRSAAQHLVSHGIRRGDRVVLPCSPSDWIGYATAYVAVQKAGAVAVPVIEKLGRRHLNAVVKSSNAAAVVTERADGIEAERILSFGGVPPATMSDGPAIEVGPADDAEIIFSSGTTGAPKGIVATHENLLFTHAETANTSECKTVIHALPPGALAGQGLLLQPLDARPHRVVAMPEFDDETFLSAIAEYGATDVVIVPTLALSLIDYSRTHEFDFSSVRAVRTMSAPIAPATLRRLQDVFHGAEIANMYTTTESWPARIRTRYDVSHPDSVGRSRTTGQVRITDADGAEQPAGVDGFIELRSPGAPQRRYLDPPAGATDVFKRDGWVRTGDIGHVDEDGYLYLVDRSADLIISGGMNISTIELEKVIIEFDGISEVAVVGIPHPLLGELVAAAVRTSGDVSLSALREHVRDRLGHPKTPRHIVVVEEFPRNPMGKIVKAKLRDSLAASVAAGAATEQADLAGRVRALWQVALGDQVADDRAGFTDLGGGSLAAIELVSRIRTDLHRRITQRDVFDAANVHDFTAMVEKAPLIENAGAGRIRPVRRRVRDAGPTSPALGNEPASES